MIQFWISSHTRCYIQDYSGGSPNPRALGCSRCRPTSLVHALPLQFAKGRVIWGKARDLHVLVKEEFIWALKCRAVHYGRAVMTMREDLTVAAGTGGSCSPCIQSGSREMNVGARLALSFLPSPGVELPLSEVGLSRSVKHLGHLPHRLRRVSLRWLRIQLQ